MLAERQSHNYKVSFSKKYTLENIIFDPIDRIDKKQILLKTLISGISAGTEGMWFDGSAAALKSGRKAYPYFPGYELVGIVVDKGSDVDSINLGDKVFAMKPHATHALLNEHDVFFKIPAHFPIENALGIALTGTALHAIHRSDVKIGDHCGVVGLGMLGFILTQILSKVHRCQLTAVTRSESKKKLATSLGAHAVIDHTQEGNPNNIYCVFDTTGLNAGIETAVKLVQSQGQVIAAGFYNEFLKIDGEQIFTKELTIKGVRGTGSLSHNTEFNRWDRGHTMRLACELIYSGQISIKDLISHKFKSKNISEAYQIIASKKEEYIQIIIDWTA